MNGDNTIRFISQRDQYGWMSNFHHAPFKYEGRRWRTVEHAFQAAKVNFTGSWAKRIAEASSPGDAKRLGRQCPLRADWESVKVGIMKKILVAKFTDNNELRTRLVRTDQVSIEEDSRWDRFWGTGKMGPGGNGRNEMGKLLMRVRAEFHESAKSR